MSNQLAQESVPPVSYSNYLQNGEKDFCNYCKLLLVSGFMTNSALGCVILAVHHSFQNSLRALSNKLRFYKHLQTC